MEEFYFECYSVELQAFPWAFSKFFKLYKWCQMAQNITNEVSLRSKFWETNMLYGLSHRFENPHDNVSSEYVGRSIKRNSLVWRSSLSHVFYKNSKKTAAGRIEPWTLMLRKKLSRQLTSFLTLPLSVDEYLKLLPLLESQLILKHVLIFLVDNINLSHISNNSILGLSLHILVLLQTTWKSSLMKHQLNTSDTSDFAISVMLKETQDCNIIWKSIQNSAKGNSSRKIYFL